MTPAVRPLRPETLAGLRAALPPGRGSCTLAFAEEVVRQVAHPLGADPSPDPAGSEAAVARRVLGLVEAAFGDEREARDAAARRLAGDAPLLAAFFQNLDLLEECASGHAGSVAALVAAALESPGD